MSPGLYRDIKPLVNRRHEVEVKLSRQQRGLWDGAREGSVYAGMCSKNEWLSKDFTVSRAEGAQRLSFLVCNSVGFSRCPCPFYKLVF